MNLKTPTALVLSSLSTVIWLGITMSCFMVLIKGLSMEETVLGLGLMMSGILISYCGLFYILQPKKWERSASTMINLSACFVVIAAALFAKSTS